MSKLYDLKNKDYNCYYNAIFEEPTDVIDEKIYGTDIIIARTDKLINIARNYDD